MFSLIKVSFLPHTGIVRPFLSWFVIGKGFVLNGCKSNKRVYYLLNEQFCVKEIFLC